jgi:L-threonylcarbamoyladenylate synthase
MSPETINEAFPEVLVLAEKSTGDNSGLPSTVAKWTGSDWQILRQGNVQLS